MPHKTHQSNALTGQHLTHATLDTPPGTGNYDEDSQIIQLLPSK